MKQHSEQSRRGGSTAELRREVRAALGRFQWLATPEELEILKRVLDDAVDLRGTGRQDRLMNLQTAFNQSLTGSPARFVRVEPELVGPVLALFESLTESLTEQKPRAMAATA